jgi:ribonuclease PH
MASSTRRTDILSLIHLRSDGRRPHEIRHMSCHLGALPSTTDCGSALPTSACSGSSLVTMGLTQVLCVVNGPCDVGRRSEELPDRYADKVDRCFSPPSPYWADTALFVNTKQSHA